MIPFNLDPPPSIFSGEFGLYADASYIETIADGSPCWWEFVDDYNRLPQPNPPDIDSPPYVPPTPPYVPPIIIPPSGPPTPVPEPSTWLLMIAGFAALFLARLKGGRTCARR